MSDKKEQHVIDAKGKRLGRIASEVATILMGKHRPDAVKHITADVIVNVENASGLDISEKKQKEKTYKRYSGYPGGLKVFPMKKLIEKKGFSEVMRKAVYGMLPNNKLRAKRMKNLIVSE